ncbi:hypothetical protein V8C34DRAFT_271657 [Trichoderma compactum]
MSPTRFPSIDFPARNNHYGVRLRLATRSTQGDGVDGVGRLSGKWAVYRTTLVNRGVATPLVRFDPWQYEVLLPKRNKSQDCLKDFRETLPRFAEISGVRASSYTDAVRCKSTRFPGCNTASSSIQQYRDHGVLCLLTSTRIRPVHKVDDPRVLRCRYPVGNQICSRSRAWPRVSLHGCVVAHAVPCLPRLLQRLPLPSGASGGLIHRAGDALATPILKLRKRQPKPLLGSFWW